jgi:histidyl-tRNA synthetase
MSGIANTQLDPELARGQAYYTGVVFEFFDTNTENSRSILGGGRYDNLTELFGDHDLAAVGFGWGDVTLRDFLSTHNLLPEYRPATELYLALTDLALAKPAAELVVALRMEGVNVSIDWSGRRIGEQIKTAAKHKVPFLIVIGEDEVKSKIYKLKNLKTGEEQLVTMEKIVQQVHYK